jgi:outer membrane protein assembly factor BamB
VVGEDGTLYIAAWSPGADAGDRIEAPTFEEYASEHDKNSNGALDLDEVPRDSAMGRRFRQIDRDKDKKITPEEYEGMRRVFATASNLVMAVRPGGRGDITASHVKWTNDQGAPYVPSPLYHEGHLFAVKNGGILSCYDARTGELVKRGRVSGLSDYYSSPVLGDGKIYLISQRGDASVISAERDWKVLSATSFGEDAYATPAIVRGRIYLRTAGHLYCFGIAGKATE